jgi:hypothetical protein
MRRTIAIGVAALAVACGGGHKSSTAQSDVPAAPASAQPGNDSAAARTSDEQRITLTGCLQGGARGGGGPVGTAGDRAAGTAGTSPAAVERFVLVEAKPASQPPGASAGVGANGAGASGGPLASGTSSYALVGSDIQLQPLVNHQVRIDGRMRSTATIYGDASGTPGRMGSMPSSSSGTAGSGIAARGSAPADTGTGAGTARTGAGASAMRTVTVDSVQDVAATCGGR